MLSGAYSQRYKTVEKQQVESLKAAKQTGRGDVIARSRRLSQETNKRRRAQALKRKHVFIREEKRRQEILTRRREEQQHATERYQRANIPVSRPGSRKSSPTRPTSALEDALKLIRGSPVISRQSSVTPGGGSMVRRSPLNSESGMGGDPLQRAYFNRSSSRQLRPQSSAPTTPHYHDHAKMLDRSLRNYVDSQSLFEQQLEQHQQLLVEEQQKSLRSFNKAIQKEMDSDSKLEGTEECLYDAGETTHSDSLSSLDSLEEVGDRSSGRRGRPATAGPRLASERRIPDAQPQLIQPKATPIVGRVAPNSASLCASEDSLESSSKAFQVEYYERGPVIGPIINSRMSEQPFILNPDVMEDYHGMQGVADQQMTNLNTGHTSNHDIKHDSSPADCPGHAEQLPPAAVPQRDNLEGQQVSSNAAPIYSQIPSHLKYPGAFADQKHDSSRHTTLSTLSFATHSMHPSYSAVTGNHQILPQSNGTIAPGQSGSAHQATTSVCPGPPHTSTLIQPSTSYPAPVQIPTAYTVSHKSPIISTVKAGVSARPISGVSARPSPGISARQSPGVSPARHKTENTAAVQVIRVPSDTTVVRVASETTAVRVPSETTVVRAAPETMAVRAPSDTMAVRVAPETTAVRPAAETTVVGVPSDTMAVKVAPETTAVRAAPETTARPAPRVVPVQGKPPQPPQPHPPTTNGNISNGSLGKLSVLSDMETVAAGDRTAKEEIPMNKKLSQKSASDLALSEVKSILKRPEPAVKMRKVVSTGNLHKAGLKIQDSIELARGQQRGVVRKASSKKSVRFADQQSLDDDIPEDTDSVDSNSDSAVPVMKVDIQGTQKVLRRRPMSARVSATTNRIDCKMLRAASAGTARPEHAQDRPKAAAHIIAHSIEGNDYLSGNHETSTGKVAVVRNNYMSKTSPATKTNGCTDHSCSNNVAQTGDSAPAIYQVKYPNAAVCSQLPHGAASTQSKVREVYDENGLRIDRTPTDEEINWLWDKVRTCLNREPAPVEKKSATTAPASDPNLTMTASRQAAPVSNKYMDGSSLGLKGITWTAPPSSNSVMTTYGNSVQQQAMNTMARGRAASAGSGGYMKKYGLLQQRRQREAFRTAQQQQTSMMHVPMQSNSDPQESESMHVPRGDVNESMAMFLVAEHLAGQSMSDSQVQLALEESRRRHRDIRSAKTRGQPGPSALSMEEQKLLESLEKLNEKLKVSEGRQVPAVNTKKQQQQQQKQQQHHLYMHSGGFRGHPPISQQQQPTPPRGPTPIAFGLRVQSARQYR